MTKESRRKLFVGIGYAAFFAVSFFYFVYRTFPYDAVLHRASSRMRGKMGIDVRVNKIWPSFFTGMGAEGLNIRKVFPKKGTVEVTIDEVNARIGLFSLLGGTISASLGARVAKGEVDARISKKGPAVRARVKIDGLQIERLQPPPGAARGRRRGDPVQPLVMKMIGFPVFGKITARADVTGNLKDYRKAKGTIEIKVTGLSVGPGIVKHKQYGEVGVPNVHLGTLRARIKVSRGAARITEFSAQGRDAEAHLEGFIQLHPKFRYSVFIGRIRFRLARKFLDRKENSLLKTAMSMAYRARSKDGFYHWRIRWPFKGKPQWLMGRRRRR